MKEILFGLLFLFSFCAFAQDDRALDEAFSTLQKSKTTRTEIEKTLPKRQLASIKEEEVALAEEFQNLMENDDDKEYFDEIDQLIK